MSEAIGTATAASAPFRVGILAALGASLLVGGTLLGTRFHGTAPLVESQLPPAFAWFEFGAAVVAVVAAWSQCTQHPRVAVGLAVAITGLVLQVWAGWPALAASARTATMAAAPFLVAGIAHVALRWRRDATRSSALRAVYLLVSIAALIHLAGYDPSAEPGCPRICSDVTPPAAGLLDTRTAVAISGMLTIAAAATAAAAVLADRRGVAPLVTGGVLTALAILAVMQVLRWVMWTDSLGLITLLLLLPSCAAAMVGAAVLITAVRAWRVRVAIVRLAARLESPDARTGGFGRAITRVQFALPGTGWIDELGRPVAEELPRRHQVTVSDPSGPVARLALAPGRDAGNVARALTPTIRLSLGNAQLAATTRARVAETQASRRRVVAASDAERRRIERDLHDGAQQRLVGAAFYLRVARGRLGGGPSQLADTESAVRRALDQLRRLAHGAFPSLLSSEALGAALEELAHGSAIPTTVTADQSEVEAEVARAIYATVAAALRHAERERSATQARVAVFLVGDAIRTTIDVDGDTSELSAPDYTDAADRIGALGGTLTSVATARGTTLEAVLPCAS
ncbi:MAG TPA: histidine kinase [Terrimesophilobacter sp.]|nr:histidine kinase [Terrimesophilobacter sp.]